ncbi:MAG: hypothetical protein Ct9H300mP26_4470 [Acidimicrobiales bacterium]|nr:MAG: hypothetical protein Ct9H300mP26_4470 [Acidimicrobiales bacterium]
MFFPAFNLIPTLSARENIVLNPNNWEPVSPEKSFGFDQVIDAVGLADRLSHRPNELSGDNNNGSPLQSALAGQPEIIFADEPTGNLDSKTGDEILGFMQKPSGI